MPLYITDAIVLDSMDFGESDRIITFFTLSNGKLKGIAKGAKKSKKRFGINLEPFSMVRLQFFEKRDDSLVRVSSCDLLNPFQGIREDLLKISYGSYMLEAVDKLSAEKVRHPGTFTLLAEFLGLLENKGINRDLMRVFEIKLLDGLGLRPHVSGCVICRLPLTGGHRINFSLEKGGAVCGRCSRGLHYLLPVSPGTLKTLEMALKIDPKKSSNLIFNNIASSESREILQKFIGHHTGRRMMSLEFMEKMGIDEIGQ